MGSQPSSVCGVQHRRRRTNVLSWVHGHGRLFGVCHRGRGRMKNWAEDHLRRQHRERLKDGRWIIRHVSGVKLVADFLTKIIAVKPSWERFWRFFFGTRREETRSVEEPAGDITVNPGQDQPAHVSNHFLVKQFGFCWRWFSTTVGKKNGWRKSGIPGQIWWRKEDWKSPCYQIDHREKDSSIALVRERIQEPPTKLGIWFFNFWSPPDEELHAEGIKGESAPLGLWRKRVFALLAGGRASSQWERGHPLNLLFRCWVTWIPASRKAECGWEVCAEYHCTTMRSFWIFSRSLRAIQLWRYWLKGQSNDWLKYTEPNLERKGCTCICLMVGFSGKGLGSVKPRGFKSCLTHHCIVLKYHPHLWHVWVYNFSKPGTRSWLRCSPVHFGDHERCPHVFCRFQSHFRFWKKTRRMALSDGDAYWN